MCGGVVIFRMHCINTYVCTLNDKKFPFQSVAAVEQFQYKLKSNKYLYYCIKHSSIFNN